MEGSTENQVLGEEEQPVCHPPAQLCCPWAELWCQAPRRNGEMNQVLSLPTSPLGEVSKKQVIRAEVGVAQGTGWPRKLYLVFVWEQVGERSWSGTRGEEEDGTHRGTGGWGKRLP